MINEEHNNKCREDLEHNSNLNLRYNSNDIIDQILRINKELRRRFNGDA